MAERMPTDSRSMASEERSVAHMGLAAFLWYNHHYLDRLEWSRPNEALFFFTEDEDMERDVKRFQEGKARVDPQRFYPKMTEFKRMVYERRPEQ